MESIIKNKAAEILGGEVVVVERLLGGMSNYTYVIKKDNEKFTFRLPGKNAHHFVDRNIEKKNIQLAESLGITNHTIYFNEVDGIKIAKHIEATVLSTLNRTEHLDKVAEVLKVIHNSGLKAENDYGLLERLTSYEKLLRVINPRYVKLKEMWLKLYDKYKSVTKVLTHGDAQPSNFLIIDDHALIVDFEFTANNDPYYDIACFGNIDFADAEALLDVYLDNKTSDEAVKRLIFNRYFQCLQWHLVATYKHNIGLSEQLHIPFDKVSIIYLDKIDVLLKKYNEVL
ncbi:MAG TPA: choline/ethanolamine kinase family protein [Acholeplasma sp.]|nr:choline/ethanolamine kinase family protein [Acholeplasma sp.]